MTHPPIRVVAAILLASAITLACSRTETETITAATETTETTATSTMATDTTATTTTMPMPSPTLQQADQDFVMKAAQGGLAEVLMGQVGSQKATNPDVKAFAARMVSDHGQANGELTQLALTKSLTLPAEPAEEHKLGLQHLNGLSGTEFDAAYMVHMVADHEKDLKEFESAARNVQDPDVKAWAAKKLPILQEHLRLAKETQAKVK